MRTGNVRNTSENDVLDVAKIVGVEERLIAPVSSLCDAAYEIYWRFLEMSTAVRVQRPQIGLLPVLLLAQAVFDRQRRCDFGFLDLCLHGLSGAPQREVCRGELTVNG